MNELLQAVIDDPINKLLDRLLSNISLPHEPNRSNSSTIMTFSSLSIDNNAPSSNDYEMQELLGNNDNNQGLKQRKNTKRGNRHGLG